MATTLERRARAPHAGPPVRPRRRRSRRRPTSPRCSPASSGGTTPRPPARSPPTASWSPPRRPTPRDRGTPPDDRADAADRADGTRRRWAGAVEVPDAVVDELRGVAAVIDDEARWPSQPRLVAAGDALVARRPGAARARGRRPTGVGRRGRRGRADLRRQRRAAHRRRRPQRRLRRLGAGVRRRRARHHRARRHRRRRRRLGGRRGARRDVRPRPRGRAAGRPRAVSVGHFPQSFDLATVGGWVACRGAGQYSTRYGKIEDLVVGLEVVLADGAVDPHRRRSGGSRRPRPHPALPRVGGHARRRSPACGCAPTRCRRRSGGAAWTFASFADGIEACRHGPAPRRDAGGAAPLRRVESARATAATGAQHAARARRGRPGDRRRHDGRRRRCLRGGRRAGSRRAGRRVAAPPQRHLRAAGADAQGFRRRHDGDRRARGRGSPSCSTTCARRCWPCPTPGSPAATCRTATRTAPASTSRSPPRRPPTEVEATYVALWDAGQRAVLAGGGNLSHHHGVGLNRARFVAEALGAASSARGRQGGARPDGILNPGKLGLPSAFGDRPWPPP